MRLPLQAPVEMAELVLVYLSIGDKKGIICALAEAVWIGPAEGSGMTQIGLRFLNIMEEDQERIDAVVKILLEQLGKTGDE
jgi:c-di-GMP-binding flagellar brake protein YcgR